MTPPPYSGTQAVLRAVRLLKAFTSAQPQRTLADLSRSLGLNKTTAYRLLTALASEGMVVRDAAIWRLGPALLALAGRAQGAGDLREAARPELVALARRTRETATLEVLAGREVLILDEVQGGHVLGSTPSAGTRWAAHATSTGKTLLAHLDEAELAQVLPPRLAALTTRTVTEASGLRRELARVRERGWALSDEELEMGFTALGAPVREAGGRVVGAISVGGPKARMSAQRRPALARAVMAAAARVSRRLGGGENSEGGNA